MIFDIDIELGLHLDMPEARYHAIPFVGSGGAKALHSMSLHAYHDEYIINRGRKKEGDKRDMLNVKLGSAWHDALLLPKVFAERWHGCPHRSNTNAYKAWVADTGAQKEFTLPEREYERIVSRVESVRELPGMQPFLRDGHSEVSGFWHDPETGLPCKFRIDRAVPATGRFLDLKTGPSLNERTIYKKMVDEFMAMQVVHYLDGWHVIHTEKSIDWEAGCPYHFYFAFMRYAGVTDEVMLRNIHPESLKAAAKTRRVYLRRLTEAYESDKWPRTLSAPKTTFIHPAALTPKDL